MATPQQQIIWLTGGSGGLGPGIASMLVEQGYAVAIHAHTQVDRAEDVAGRLRNQGGNLMITAGDLAEPGVAERCVAEIERELGSVYGLVHAAGPIVIKRVAEHTAEEFDLMLRGNLTTFHEAVKAVLPAMREHREGRIIGFGMAGSRDNHPMRYHGPHLAAKAGLVALARTLALEEAPHQVTVNVVSPGHITKKSLPREEAHKLDSGPEFPLGHPGSYEDIGDAVLYLLSRGAGHVTGTVLEVTGGWMGDDWRPRG